MLPSVQRCRYFLGLTLLFGSLAGTALVAEPGVPAPPKSYAVQIRYRIYASRSNRIEQFRKMVEYLESIGFQKNPGPEDEAEDPYQTRMNGTIAAANARKILEEPHVQEVLLTPPEYQVPDDPETPVWVNLDLVPGFPPDRQRLLADEVRARLARLGFREAAGYDHHGHTRLEGTVPASAVRVADAIEQPSLLKDLRFQPSGWLISETPADQLPVPLKTISPIRVVEIVPDLAPLKEPAAPPRPAQGQEYLLKIAPNLRDLAAQEGAAEPVRMEAILNYTPAADDRNWRAQVASVFEGDETPIEGRLGPLVTMLASTKAALALARQPFIATVRLPRPALTQSQPLLKTGEGNRQALQATGLAQLQSLGHQGKGVRLAVVDGDFRGYEGLIGKDLPRGTHLVDLTAERNHTLAPDQFPSDPGILGHGTQSALAVALAAPQAELTLIRIDPAAPHQLEAVARYIDGEAIRSESSVHREEELAADNARLISRQQQLEVMRKAILNQFGEDEETRNRRAAYFKEKEDFEADRSSYQDRLRRFQSLQRDLHDLKGIRIVSSSLIWNDGYPLGDRSPLSRYFDERPFRSALWFQSSGNTFGQAWAGLYHDADGNGVMEFAPPGSPLRPGRWTSELNFLAWQRFVKDKVPELPAKAKLRVSLQWREVHDPEVFRRPEDMYRRPLADLRLVVVRQRDPVGAKVQPDVMDVVARSGELPQRLDNQPTSATYEQTVEFTVDEPGRYAVRVEGPGAVLADRLSDNPRTVPDGHVLGTRPSSAPTLPGYEKSWDLWPRLFVDAIDPASRKTGRPVFLDYPTELGTLGMPADARGVVTVGAASLAGKKEPYSANGSPVNLGLLMKPDILMYDSLQVVPEGTEAAYGTSLATALAAGMAGTALSAGSGRVDLLQAVQSQQGQVWHLP